ncbi:DUF6146 family protein [Marinilabilia sp.]|uniref:DUF6146 family protein n=1 Tax=Marinilabilia sp. TaxID=2021252 RepID=UPI0025BB77B2|nr:DUF6146 family protein [Marinilabilia sp.]
MKAFNEKGQSSASFFLLTISAGVLLALCVNSCKTTKKTEVTNQKIELIKEDSTAKEDSTEYELIIMDSRFESWLATQPPANYYSQQYYESWNHRYVTEWNNRHNNPLRYDGFYETHIDYDPNTDYGLELNYKLYYYFRFIEKEYGIVLVPRGR